MKIVHIADIDHNKSNGIKTVLDALIPEQIKLGNEVYLFNIFKNCSKQNWEIFISSSLNFIISLKRILPDVVIFHSVYKFKYIEFSFILRCYRIPYMIMPHGGTSFLNHQKSFLKKKIADLLFVKDVVKNASSLIYLNQPESSLCVFKGIRKNVCLIPNGIYINPIGIRRKRNNSKLKLIYLSRIDFSQKAVDYLLIAWNKFQENNIDKNVELHFYGNISDSSEKNRFFNMLNNCKGVFYHGMVVGKEKEYAYCDGDIFILTSRYEGMPMAILEALSYKLPCIITPNTNMADVIIENNCGWVCNLDVEDIANTISRSVSDYMLQKEVLMNNAQNAILPYMWNKIAELSIKEYRSIL